MKTLRKQIKANSGSINCDLGGGKQGHLGLVLPEIDYTKLSTEPYTEQTHPGSLNIPIATAHHEAVRLREKHNEKLYIFCEALNIENIFKS